MVPALTQIHRASDCARPPFQWGHRLESNSIVAPRAPLSGVAQRAYCGARMHDGDARLLVLTLEQPLQQPPPSTGPTIAPGSDCTHRGRTTALQRYAPPRATGTRIKPTRPGLASLQSVPRPQVDRSCWTVVAYGMIRGPRSGCSPVPMVTYHDSHAAAEADPGAAAEPRPLGIR
jgi:hypothetical protein